MISWISMPHLWAAVALVAGVFAPVVPEAWVPYLKALSTAASGLVALCLQWQDGKGLDYNKLADAFISKTPNGKVATGTVPTPPIPPPHDVRT